MNLVGTSAKVGLISYVGI